MDEINNGTCENELGKKEGRESPCAKVGALRREKGTCYFQKLLMSI